MLLILHLNASNPICNSINKNKVCKTYKIKSVYVFAILSLMNSTLNYVYYVSRLPVFFFYRALTEMPPQDMCYYKSNRMKTAPNLP